MLANRAVARPDTPASALATVVFTIELLALVGDDPFGFGLRFALYTREESAHFIRGRLFVTTGCTQDPTAEVIHDDRHPSAERP